MFRLKIIVFGSKLSFLVKIFIFESKLSISGSNIVIFGLKTIILESTIVIFRSKLSFLGCNIYFLCLDL